MREGGREAGGRRERQERRRAEQASRQGGGVRERLLRTLQPACSLRGDGVKGACILLEGSGMVPLTLSPLREGAGKS